MYTVLANPTHTLSLTNRDFLLTCLNQVSKRLRQGVLSHQMLLVSAF
jgi:hypothetical protein